MATFENKESANMCLETLKEGGTDNLQVTAKKNTRMETYHGVIRDWQFSLNELWEAVDDKEEIVKIERMYKNRWSNVEEKMVQNETGNFIITYKGSKCREKLGIWNNKYVLKVSPYFRPVKQCLNCYRFGHTKAVCKSAMRCVICGGDKHGKCEKKECCRNCGGEHRSTSKKCVIYERNKKINTIMAFNNVKYQDAVKVLEGKEIAKTSYDRYIDPQEWPQIGGRENMNRDNLSRSENTTISIERRQEDHIQRQKYSHVLRDLPNRQNNYSPWIRKSSCSNLRTNRSNEMINRRQSQSNNMQEITSNEKEEVDKQNNIRKKSIATMLEAIKDPLVIEKIIEFIAQNIDAMTRRQEQSGGQSFQLGERGHRDRRGPQPTRKEEREIEKRISERNRVREIRKQYWESRNKVKPQTENYKNGGD